ncbi:MAG: MoaD/ThiS family protein [Myxococcales bacterium]|jgi:molybdopterin synthase sulfur carrier subunit|nr:MAG: MoaD/ThiS family protein [Myxococcales bacterium]
MPVVVVPPPYRGPTAGEGEIRVDAITVLECIEAVEARFPGFRDQVFDGRGAVHRFVTLFVNGDEIARESLDARLAPEDRLEILAAIAGG